MENYQKQVAVPGSPWNGGYCRVHKPEVIAARKAVRSQWKDDKKSGLIEPDLPFELYVQHYYPILFHDIKNHNLAF